MGLCGSSPTDPDENEDEYSLSVTGSRRNNEEKTETLELKPREVQLTTTSKNENKTSDDDIMHLQQSFFHYKKQFDSFCGAEKEMEKAKLSDALIALGLNESEVTYDKIDTILTIGKLKTDVYYKTHYNFKDFMTIIAVIVFKNVIDLENTSKSFRSKKIGFDVAFEIFNEMDIDNNDEINFDQMIGACVSLCEDAHTKDKLKELGFRENKTINVIKFSVGLMRLAVDMPHLDISNNKTSHKSTTSKQSIFEKCLSGIAYCINWILLIWTALHLNISLSLLFIINERKCGCNRVFVNSVWSVNAILTSVLVSYYGFIYSGIYNEFQSFMYAYISWITIIWIQFLLDVVIGIYSRRQLKLLSYVRMKILGITITKKKHLYKDRYKDHWMVPISSLLPTTIIGFIANYVLEEKFVLKCNSILQEGDICYDDGRACCVVVSSHDVDNMVDFLARLASHILAAFGIIRIVAWFMISRNNQIRKIATKN